MNSEINKDQIWAAVAGELEVGMSRPNFLTWIKPCFIDSISEIDEERVLIELACPSVYIQQTIDERYYGQIKKGLEAKTGKICEIALVVRQKTTEVSPARRETAEKEGGEGKEEVKVRENEERSRERTDAREDGLFNQNLASSSVRDKCIAAGINPKFSFENLIVGGSNNLAYAAARGVVENPGGKHNPMFIWGGVGVGKTHLMHAIGRELIEKGFDKVYMVTSEQFTNELVSTLRSKTVDSFKKKYRNLDALMIDDIQFIAGKESTQEEFFHTFNELYIKGKQIIMTSDRRPQDISQVEQRLISRFLGGLTVDIGLPDYEMRLAILRQKAVEIQAEVEPEALDLLASVINTNVRELEGVLIRLINIASSKRSKLTREIVEAEMGVKNKKAQKKLRPQEVISLVAKQFEFKNKDMVGNSRKAELVRARHITMFILRMEMGLQLQRVAELFGGRDHTTVMHAVEKMKREFELNNEVREQIMRVKQAIYAGG